MGTDTSDASPMIALGRGPGSIDAWMIMFGLDPTFNDRRYLYEEINEDKKRRKRDEANLARPPSVPSKQILVRSFTFPGPGVYHFAYTNIGGTLTKCSVSSSTF